MGKKLYDKADGVEAYLYTISDGDIQVDICDFGARINALRINGADIVLGFNSVGDYVKSNCCAGATIGRVANRIARGQFALNGKSYQLNLNNGANHLHGGFYGFDKKQFKVLEFTQNSLTMQYVSPDGEENYPGTLTFTVKFTVADNALLIEFEGISDKDTLWCPTNHAYFNLDGVSGGGDCRNNLLRLNADYYTPVDGGLIPTGEKRAVAGTPFDFNTQKAIGTDFASEQLRATNGYDHNYLLKGGHAAHAESTVTGITMDVYTDMPCLQFYTGGQLNGADGKNGRYFKWAGFCLEPHYCPNAINMQGFDKPVIKAGERVSHYIKLAF